MDWYSSALAAAGRKSLSAKSGHRLPVRSGSREMANAALPKKGTDMQKGVAEVLDFIEPDYLKDPVAFLYLSGWRSGEMKSLEWRDVGAEAIRLRAEKSKNKKPRVLPLRGELVEIVQRAKDTRKLECPLCLS